MNTKLNHHILELNKPAKDTSVLCQATTEVYSRVVGFYRPVGAWNVGKQEEFKDRATYDIPDQKH